MTENRFSFGIKSSAGISRKRFQFVTRRTIPEITSPNTTITVSYTHLRERLSSIAWKMEYEFMIVLSMIPGYILGMGIYYLLREMLEKEIGVLIDGKIQFQIFFLSGVLYLCLSGIIIWLSSILLRRELRGEKRNIRNLLTPAKSVVVITVILSLGYLIFSIGRYMQRRNGESLNIFVYGITLGGMCVLCSIRLFESLNRRWKTKKLSSTFR